MRNLLETLSETFLRPRFAPLYLPLPFTNGDRRLKMMHWDYTTTKLRHAKSWFRKCGYVVMTLFWPILALLQALLAVREYGGNANRKKDKGSAPLFFASWWYSVAYCQPAFAYFHYRLDHPENRRRCNAFFHLHESMELLLEINPLKDSGFLVDKTEFERRCSEEGLATVAILADVREGAVQWRNHATKERPECDLFLKPNDMYGGRGTECFRYLGDDTFETSERRRLSRRELEEFIPGFVASQRYILQPRVENHPLVDEFSAGAACSLRVVTAFDPIEDQTCVFMASLKVSAKGAVTDALRLGGGVCPIDLETGVLGEVVTKHLRFVGDRHPDSRAPVAGKKLPYWKEALDLCLRGQRRFKVCPCIGWDVVVTPEGPVLLEGNNRWNPDLLQLPNNFPLGLAGFVDFYENWKRARWSTAGRGEKAAP